MGIFNLFKPSAFSKVHTLLQKNGLIPQATILRFAKKNGYLNFSNPNNPTCFTDTHRDKEILLLVAQKVNIPAAMKSRMRFQEAVKICDECGLKNGVIMFKQYVNLYEYYIDNYSDDDFGGAIFF